MTTAQYQLECCGGLLNTTDWPLTPPQSQCRVKIKPHLRQATSKLLLLLAVAAVSLLAVYVFFKTKKKPKVRTSKSMAKKERRKWHVQVSSSSTVKSSSLPRDGHLRQCRTYWLIRIMLLLGEKEKLVDRGGADCRSSPFLRAFCEYFVDLCTVA